MFGGKKNQPPMREAKLIEYEYKTERIITFVRSTEKRADKRIAELQKQGWEYVDMATHGMSSSLTLQFRRPRKR